MTRHSTRRMALCLAVILALTLVATGCKPAPKKDIIVGVIAPLTGSKADQGRQFKEAAELRVKEINDAGGLLGGRKIVLEIMDDEGTPANAATCAQKLAANPDVVAVIGPSSTASCNAAIPILEKAKIIGLSPSASTPSLATENPYFFILGTPLTLYASSIAKLAMDQFGAKKVAMISVKDDWGQNCANEIKKAIPDLGLELTGEALYAQGDRDFKAQITSLMAGKPDVLLFNSHYTEGALAAKQARESGVTIPIIGQSTNVYPEFLQIYGRPDGFVAHVAFLGSLDLPSIKKANAKFEPVIGRQPNSYHITTYDGLSVLALAIEKVGNTTDRDAIVKAIAATKDFQGVANVWGFNEEKLADTGRFWVQVKDGKWAGLELK